MTAPLFFVPIRRVRRYSCPESRPRRRDFVGIPSSSARRSERFSRELERFFRGAELMCSEGRVICSGGRAICSDRRADELGGPSLLLGGWSSCARGAEFYARTPELFSRGAELFSPRFSRKTASAATICEGPHARTDASAQIQPDGLRVRAERHVRRFGLVVKTPVHPAVSARTSPQSPASAG